MAMNSRRSALRRLAGAALLPLAGTAAAPERFSTTTFWPSGRLARSASSRIVRSVAPPAGQGTHSDTGCWGKRAGDCDRAGAATTTAGNSAPASRCSAARRGFGATVSAACGRACCG